MKEETYSFLKRGGYILLRYKNMCVVTRYGGKGLMPYLEEIGRMFIDFIVALITLVSFPFKVVIALYRFVPRIMLVKSYEMSKTKYNIDAITQSDKEKAFRNIN